MNLDPSTLLVVASFATTIMAVALILLWASDRRDSATLWLAGATLLCVISAVLREILPSAVAIIVANVMLAFGLGAIATACRVLGRREVSWSALFVAPVLWVLACAIPAFFANQQIRTIASSLLCAAIMAWAVVELWRERRERLMSRWGLMAILTVQCVAALARAGVTALTHQSGQGVARTADVSRTTFWAFGFLLLIGFAFVFLVRERIQFQLRHCANEDRLTGLANGRWFDEALEAAFAEALSSGSLLAVLAVEADAMQAETGLNSRVTANASLITIAQVISATVTPVDGVVAHHGDGRFAVLLRGLPTAEVLRIADAMRGSVRDATAMGAGPAADPLTISIGYATAVPAQTMEALHLHTAAAAALDAARHSGRDRVLRSDFPDSGSVSAVPEPAGWSARPT